MLLLLLCFFLCGKNDETDSHLRGALCREIAAAAACRTARPSFETVYFGGGTPTTLDAGQLNSLLKAVHTHFDLSGCREFTVEAGRP